MMLLGNLHQTFFKIFLALANQLISDLPFSPLEVFREIDMQNAIIPAWAFDPFYFICERVDSKYPLNVLDSVLNLMNILHCCFDILKSSRTVTHL